MGKWNQALSFGGPVYTWGSKAFDVVLLSVYWVVGCLPVVTAGCSAAALYYATDHSVFQDRSTATKAFWHSFRQNLKMGCAHTLVTGAAGFVLLLNFGICRARLTGHLQWLMCGLYLALTALTVMNACWLFPMVAGYDMPFGWYLRGSLFCLFRYFPVSLLLLGMVGAGYWSVYKFPLTVLFIPGIYSVVTVPIVRKRIARFGPPTQEEAPEPMETKTKYDAPQSVSKTGSSKSNCREEEAV